MSKNSTIYRCFAPTRVQNKTTKEFLFADCGRCEACRNKRSYELANRIDREMLYHLSKGHSIYFISLDYKNECLPVFEEVPEEDIFGNVKSVWRSNRADDLPRYDFNPIVTDFYYPVNYGNTRCFGHLCYEDVLSYQGKIRTHLHKSVSRRNKKLFNELFKGLTYNDVKYRYFLLGEYGPATMRPHYHLLVWFSQQWNKEQEKYIHKIFSESWSLGSVDIQAVTSGGVKNYLSNYVTGYIGLPEVLRDKPLSPFCTFSKNPVIGSYRLDEEEIQEVLTNGTHSRIIYNEKTKEFEPDSVSPSYWRRYFPKCTGFSIKSFDEKLRVYSYVFDYFGDKGIKHNELNVDNLTLKDIEFPRRWFNEEEKAQRFGDYVEKMQLKCKRKRTGDRRAYLTDTDRELIILTSEELAGFEPYEDWNYLDKYASLTCYKYCVKYGYIPVDFLRAIEQIYMKQDFDRLKKFYEHRAETIKDNSHCDRFNLNFDMEFIYQLPSGVHDLEQWQIFSLENYGVNLELLYPDEILDVEYLHYRNDVRYQEFESCTKLFSLKGVKTKKLNDYKKRVEKNYVEFVLPYCPGYDDVKLRV